jgi:hypothetical protein
MLHYAGIRATYGRVEEREHDARRAADLVTFSKAVLRAL